MRALRLPVLAAAFLSLSSRALAWGWLTAEGGWAPDYHREALSGGFSLDEKDDFLLQAQAGKGAAANGQPRQETRAMDYNLGLGYFPDRNWDFSLDGSYACDTSNQASGGGELTLGLHKDYDWLKPSLSAKAGMAAHSLSFNGATQQLSSVKEGLVLGFGLSEFLSIGGSATMYQYSAAPYGGHNVSNTGLNPSDSGGFLPFLRPYLPAPRGSQHGQQSNAVRNALLFGFPSRDWSAGLTFTLPAAGSTLSGDYSQVEDRNSGAWMKSVGAALRQEFGEEKEFAARLGWAKAVESGSDQPFFSGGLTYYFRAAD